jgi:MFS family permease
LVVAVLPLVAALIKWPSDHSALYAGSSGIQLLLWSFPFGLLIAANGARIVRNYIAADELKIPNERKDPRARRNMVFLLAALLTLSSGILLLSARSFESPENTAERELHVTSISNLSLLIILGFFIVIAGFVMTIGALLVKRIPRPTQSFLYAPGTMALFFSLFIVGVTVVGIRTVAGLA